MLICLCYGISCSRPCHSLVQASAADLLICPSLAPLCISRRPGRAQLQWAQGTGCGGGGGSPAAGPHSQPGLFPPRRHATQEGKGELLLRALLVCWRHGTVNWAAQGWAGCLLHAVSHGSVSDSLTAHSQRTLLLAPPPPPRLCRPTPRPPPQCSRLRPQGPGSRWPPAAPCLGALSWTPLPQPPPRTCCCRRLWGAPRWRRRCSRGWGWPAPPRPGQVSHFGGGHWLLMLCCCAPPCMGAV